MQLFVPPCYFFRFLAVFLFLRVKNLLRQDEARDKLRKTAKYLKSVKSPRRTGYGTELIMVQD